MTDVSLPKIPKMSHHRASGKAIVRLAGKDHYLGPWGSRAAAREYDRLVAEWLAGGRQNPDGMMVSQLIAAFWEFACGYYRHADGTQTHEISNFREVLKPLRRLYGHTPAAEFGPLALKAVRQAMIDGGWCRTNINRQVGRLKHVFKWGVENELVPPTVYQGLLAVAGLKAGRSEAHESAPIKPVSEEKVLAVLGHVSRQVAAMIQLQSITGMRPGEVVTMREMDIDRTGNLWVFRPVQHKTGHLGHDRSIYLGPKAQRLIMPFLNRELEVYLFSPAEAEAERRQAAHEHRQTPMSCGNRPGSNVKRKPAKRAGACYTRESYARAIKDACERAFPLPLHLGVAVVENVKRETRAAWWSRLTEKEKEEVKAHRKAHHWHPHQLRHSAATRLRKDFGLETAQLILGHKSLTITQVYAEKNAAAAMRTMAEAG